MEGGTSWQRRNGLAVASTGLRFLAAIPLLLGGILSVYFAWDAKLAYDHQAKLVCAQTALNSAQQLKLLGLPRSPLALILTVSATATANN